MDIVIDASAILAVIIGEPERDRIVEMTSGHNLVGPGSIPWEIGNAFSSMLKQHRVGIDEVRQGLTIFQSIAIRYLAVDLENALSIAHSTNLYAQGFVPLAEVPATPPENSYINTAITDPDVPVFYRARVRVAGPGE